MQPDHHPHYHADTIVLQGQGHRDDNVNCQDAAIARSSRRGVAVAVADGVSCIELGPETHVTSQTEAGAWIVTRVAAASAIKAVDAGVPLDQLAEPIAASLFRALRGIWQELDADAQWGLLTTLQVGVVTDQGAVILGSGDGSFGMVVAPEPAAAEALAAGDEADLGDMLASSRNIRHAGGATKRCIHGVGVMPGGRGLASVGAWWSLADVRSRLHLRLLSRAPVFGLYVATDGADDEPDALDTLRTLSWRTNHGRLPLRDVGRLARMLTRPPNCDDFGAAWVTRTQAEVRRATAMREQATSMQIGGATC